MAGTDSVTSQHSKLAAYHSVRLFPKNRGANAYSLSGIAALCDLVVLSDNRLPLTHVKRQRNVKDPRTIFVSLRNATKALRHFVDDVLPTLQGRFVLLTGSEDVTLPRQTDQRWPSFDQETRDRLNMICRDPRLVHWFAENLDDDMGPRVSALPTGMVYPDGDPDFPPCHEPPALRSRPLNVLCGHRVRAGPQWETRRRVFETANTAWADFTTCLSEEVPEPEFLRLIEAHSFVLCVEGGGLDPSPKAWQCLIHGAIPIIRRTRAAQAYRDLPCVVLEDWNSQRLNIANLAAWKERLCDDFDLPAKRADVMSKLTLGQQWSRVEHALHGIPDTDARHGD